MRAALMVGKPNDFDCVASLHFYECIYGKHLQLFTNIKIITQARFYTQDL